MARHGRGKSQKRISSSGTAHIAKKEATWTIKASPGPHSAAESIPLGTVIRDVLHTARNSHEIKIILNKRSVSVDSVIRTSKKFPVGLFDVVAFSDSKKQFRVCLDRHGRFCLREIPAKSAAFKLVRVTGKRAAKGKKITLQTNNGRVITIAAGQKTGIGDSLKISLPEQKILESFALEKGNTVFVFRGARLGATAEITDVLAGTIKRGKLVVLKPKEGNEFQTVAENVFVVGRQKPEIET